MNTADFMFVVVEVSTKSKGWGIESVTWNRWVGGIGRYMGNGLGCIKRKPHTFLIDIWLV